MSRKLLFILVLAIISCCIEVDMSVPSLPDISDYFDISDGLTQMTIAINFFGFCISAAIYGPLSESFGRRRVMVVGNAIMFIGAFGCAASTSIEMLLVSRFIQGVGASTSAVLVFAMVADLCSGPRAAEVVGRMNSMITIIMSGAPIAGGFINKTIGWRGNYGTVFIIALIAWIVIYYKLPETKKSFERFSAKKIARDYFTLFSSPIFMVTSLVPSLMFAGYMSFIACGAFLYMETYNLPIMYYAFCQGTIIASFSIVSEFAGKINAYLGEKKSIIYGIILLLTGATSMTILSKTGLDNPYSTTLSMITGAVGAAISYPVIFMKSFDIFPDIKGAASSAIMSVRMLAAGAVVALVSTIYNGNLYPVAAIILVVNIISTLLTIYLAKVITFADTKKDV